MPDIPSKFQKDPSIIFRVILLTHRQTNKQTKTGQKMTSLAEVINPRRPCIQSHKTRSMHWLTWGRARSKCVFLPPAVWSAPSVRCFRAAGYRATSTWLSHSCVLERQRCLSATSSPSPPTYCDRSAPPNQITVWHYHNNQMLRAQ